MINSDCHCGLERFTSRPFFSVIDEDFRLVCFCLDFWEVGLYWSCPKTGEHKSAGTIYLLHSAAPLNEAGNPAGLMGGTACQLHCRRSFVLRRRLRCRRRISDGSRIGSKTESLPVIFPKTGRQKLTNHNQEVYLEKTQLISVSVGLSALFTVLLVWI